MDKNNGKFPQNWLNLDIYTSHNETNVCFRLPPTQAKWLNPIDLPSEWWICVPLRQLIQSGFLSQLLQYQPLNGPQTLLVNRTDTWLCSFTGSNHNCFIVQAQRSVGKRGNWYQVGGLPSDPLLFPILSLSALIAGLRYMWQNSPWKPKLRPALYVTE